MDRFDTLLNNEQDEDETIPSGRMRRTFSGQNLRQLLRRKSTKTAIGVCILVMIVFIITVTVYVIKISRVGSDDNEPVADSRIHQKYLEEVSATELGKVFRSYASKAHVAGSPQNRELAIEINNTWTSYGFKTRMEEVPVYLNYPRKRSVKTVEDQPFVLTLEEAWIAADGTSKQDFDNALPPFNGYSGSGNATGPIVYANYGTEEDFILLAETYPNMTIDGAIVIVRYGRIFRGNKVKSAEIRGAKAVLMFIDPADSGYLRGKVYPEGPWSTNTTVQRGSVWVGDGDPMTPGFPSIPGGPRLTEAELDDPELQWAPLPKIPVLPINYADAQRLLSGISGSFPIPNSSWSGGLNVSHVGPGPLQLEVQVEMNFTVVSLWNVIGVLEGSHEPDRMVIAGCHRDAWTFGAGDPISGTSVLMETSRALGKLLEKSWRPQRTIVLASWDGEEYGLLGSFEFTETHAATLTRNAVTYINVDIAVDGSHALSIQGVPSLEDLMREVTGSIKLDSKLKSGTVKDVWSQKMRTLGSGTDHASFIQCLGISSLNLKFEPEETEDRYAAVYHSNYDSIFYYENFIDPGYTLHATMARVYGLTLLKIADSPILPFNHTTYADYLTYFLDHLLEVTNTSPSQLNVQPMRDAISAYRASAIAINAEIDRTKNFVVDDFTVRSINDRLFQVERVFLGDPRTSGDKWFRHVIFTPSSNNTYFGLPFPALQTALNAKDYSEALFISQRLAQIINQAAVYLGGIKRGF